MSVSPPVSRMADRQVGRNAELLSRAVAGLPTPEDRYPYLRILVSIIEQAHPEWVHAVYKERRIAALVREMCGDAIDEQEVMAVVEARDAERRG